ncbi:hypothetical protein SCUP234_12593 [Seiridium cupressi]
MPIDATQCDLATPFPDKAGRKLREAGIELEDEGSELQLASIRISPLPFGYCDIDQPAIAFSGCPPVSIESYPSFRSSPEQHVVRISLTPVQIINYTFVTTQIAPTARQSAMSSRKRKQDEEEELVALPSDESEEEEEYISEGDEDDEVDDDEDDEEEFEEEPEEEAENGVEPEKAPPSKKRKTAAALTEKVPVEDDEDEGEPEEEFEENGDVEEDDPEAEVEEEGDDAEPVKAKIGGTAPVADLGGEEEEFVAADGDEED